MPQSASPAASQSRSSRWEALRASPALRGLALFIAVAAIILAAGILPSPRESPLSSAERYAFDAQMRLLRSFHPRPIASDVVLIGIDEATEQAFPEPIALWHRRYAAVLHALALAKPRAVGVDVVLPERSYDDIVPGSDLAMMRGLVDLKRVAPLVYVQTVDTRGAPVAIQPNFANALGPVGFGIDQQLRDPDSVSRRFSEKDLSLTDVPTASLAGRMLRRLGLAVDEGFIDYSLGAPVDYVSMRTVVERASDEAFLNDAFGGRIVMLGSLTGKTDRWRLPVKLLGNDPDPSEGALAFNQPGVLVHLQVIRSHLASGLLHPLPEGLRWLLVALAALAVFVSARPAAVLAGALAASLALFAASLASIVAAQVVIPIASILLAFWLALAIRGAFDAFGTLVDHMRLRQSFAGQVSPAVMKEMLEGRLSPGRSGRQAQICVLFSDVRDFTTLTENLPPEIVTTVLQRYFDGMVQAVHRYDGTVDKFIGDGMMVLFGAPLKSADSCGDAVQCALAMMARLDALNAEFALDGLPTLTIGIGINFGTVTIGNIGSSERHNYSAIGDAVNVAARVEGLTKELGRKIVITDAVVSRIGERFHFDSLGSHKVKGHSPVNVWGIRTARIARPAEEAEAVQ